MANQQPPTMNDEFLNRLHDMELKINNQGKRKISYYTIINEPINLMVPIKAFPYNF